MIYENVRRPIASRRVFALRLARSLLIAVLVVAASLAVGMGGYRHFGHMDWVDAFSNASMILSGMGPLTMLDDRAGKIFEGLYAIYSGFIVLIVTGLVLAPVLHRFLHRMHLAEEDEAG